MLHVHATPRAFVFIGRFAELSALAAASPPQAPLFPRATPPQPRAAPQAPAPTPAIQATLAST